MNDDAHVIIAAREEVGPAKVNGDRMLVICTCIHNLESELLSLISITEHRKSHHSCITGQKIDTCTTHVATTMIPFSSSASGLKGGILAAVIVLYPLTDYCHALAAEKSIAALLSTACTVDDCPLHPALV